MEIALLGLIIIILHHFLGVPNKECPGTHPGMPFNVITRK